MSALLIPGGGTLNDGIADKKSLENYKECHPGMICTFVSYYHTCGAALTCYSLLEDARPGLHRWHLSIVPCTRVLLYQPVDISCFFEGLHILGYLPPAFLDRCLAISASHKHMYPYSFPKKVHQVETLTGSYRDTELPIKHYCQDRHTSSRW